MTTAAQTRNRMNRARTAELTEAEAGQTGRLTRVGVVAPAEDTLVGTCQGGRCLHAPVRLNAIEAVLVAAAPPA